MLTLAATNTNLKLADGQEPRGHQIQHSMSSSLTSAGDHTFSRTAAPSASLLDRGAPSGRLGACSSLRVPGWQPVRKLPATAMFLSHVSTLSRAALPRGLRAGRRPFSPLKGLAQTPHGQPKRTFLSGKAVQNMRHFKCISIFRTSSQKNKKKNNTPAVACMALLRNSTGKNSNWARGQRSREPQHFKDGPAACLCPCCVQGRHPGSSGPASLQPAAHFTESGFLQAAKETAKVTYTAAKRGEQVPTNRNPDQH